MSQKSKAFHIYFVLDRSGSMQAIRDDVVGGFNSFVEQQRNEAGECLMTLIQFDSGDPFEVLFDARPIGEVPAMTASSFCPRGGTPLYDAMGHAIANATIRAEQLAAQAKDREEILFVTFTDGLENASEEYDREMVFAAIKKRQERGWSFVYLGANQDAYAAGGAIGYAAGSTQSFRSDRLGTALAFRSLSTSSSRLRTRLRMKEVIDRSKFFGEGKDAEEDLQKRSPS